MVQIIAGRKEKGKTKYLLEMANSSMAEAKGTIVFLDKNVKHMFELDRKIRLINVFDFPIETLDAFLGFLCGIISQDHDLEEIYLDSFLTIAALEEHQDEIELAIKEVDALGEKYGVKFILSVSLDKDELPESARAFVTISL